MFKAALVFVVMLLQSAEFRASVRKLVVRPGMIATGTLFDSTASVPLAGPSLLFPR